MTQNLQPVAGVGGDRLDRKNFVRRRQLFIQIDFLAVNLRGKRFLFSTSRSNAFIASATVAGAGIDRWLSPYFTFNSLIYS